VFSGIDKAWLGSALAMVAMNAPAWFGIPVPPEVLSLVVGGVVGTGVYAMPNKE